MPKTLIFAKDDSHAEDIVHICREVFGKGNDFCKKITYKTYNPETKRYEKSESLIQEFRTSPQLRIAVTVDMIATGTDIKAFGMPALFSRCSQPRLFRADERARYSRPIADRSSSRQRRGGASPKLISSSSTPSACARATRPIRVHWNANRRLRLINFCSVSPLANETKIL